MSDEPPDLAVEDEIVTRLLGQYVCRRELGEPPRALDLLAVAAEFGDRASEHLQQLMTLYERLLAG